MARLSRLVLPGLAHHVVQRGHNGQAVFVDEVDRRAYLAALDESMRAQGVTLQAYALLDDEVRLLLTPPTSVALGRTLQSLGRRYVPAFNRRHARSGTLWEGRFRAGVVEPGVPMLHCMRLIDTLAARRGQAAAPETSRWSSAPHRLGRQHDSWLSDPREYWSLGNTPFEREAAYALLLARGLDPALESRIEHAARHGWAFGSEAFLARLAEDTGRAARPRPRGRPPRRATGS